MVTSRDTLDCHSPAAALTRTTAPSVRADRNVMMAMTDTRARPAMESSGTIGVLPARVPSLPLLRAAPLDIRVRRHGLIHNRAAVLHGSPDGGRRYWSIRAMSWVAIRTEVPNRFSSMKRRSRRRAAADRRCRSARRRAAIPAGRSAPARWRRAAFLRPTVPAAATTCGRRGRPRWSSSIDLVAVAVLAPAEDPERQRHVLEGVEMVEQAEILEHDADAPAQRS